MPHAAADSQVPDESGEGAAGLPPRSMARVLGTETCGRTEKQRASSHSKPNDRMQ